MRSGSHSALPPAGKQIPHAHAVQNRSAGFPIGVYHLAVFHIERIPRGHGPVDELSGRLLVVERDMNPYILKRVWDLAEKPMNRFETVGQHLVDAILDGVAVSEIGDPYFGARLADALDAAFALLKPSRIPRKVDIDERAEALEVKAL